MTARTRLPNRRLAETFSFEVGRLRYTCTFGRFDDGRVSEVFPNDHRVGSDAGAAACDGAVVCSIALQHGVPVDVNAEYQRARRERLALENKDKR
jgi:ribonucleoside-diphosphate reductase alpha chain